MKNPWENMPLCIYEKHMKLSQVLQLQTLNDIMKCQINDYSKEIISILGVAGGNGLEHVDDEIVKKVYGIDISQDYLDECRKRYAYLGDCLVLEKMDISDLSNDLPDTGLIIADLIIEYVGIDIFAKQISKKKPDVLSCVIQKNIHADFVSSSPFANSFSEISVLHKDIEKDELIDSLIKIGFKLLLEEECMLPNSKKFIRLDFKNICRGIK